MKEKIQSLKTTKSLKITNKSVKKKHCDLCDKPPKDGKLIPFMTLDEGMKLVCSECKPLIEAAIEEAGEKERLDFQMSSIREEANIPNIYNKKSFEDIRTDVKFLKKWKLTGKEVESIRSAKESGLKLADDIGSGESRFMLFMGEPGTGKTLMACAIANRIIEHGVSCQFKSATPLMYSMMKPEDYGLVLEELSYKKLLVIDDFTTVVASTHTEKVMYDIVNLAYNDGDRSIIITTNLKDDMLKKRIGPGVWDRIRERGGRIKFNWKSLRK